MDNFSLTFLSVATAVIAITASVTLYIYYVSSSIPPEVVFCASEVFNSSAQYLSDNVENVMISLEQQINTETGISEASISKPIEQDIEYSPIIVGEKNEIEIREEDVDSLINFDTFEKNYKRSQLTNPVEGEKGENIKGLGKENDVITVEDQESQLKKDYRAFLHTCTFVRTRLLMENFDKIPSSGFVASYKKYMLLVDKFFSDLLSIPLAFIGCILLIRENFEIATDLIGKTLVLEPLKNLVNFFDDSIKNQFPNFYSHVFEPLKTKIVLPVCNLISKIISMPFFIFTRWTRAELKAAALLIIILWNYVILTNENAAYFFEPAPLYVYLTEIHIEVFDFLFLTLGWHRLAFWWFNLPISHLDIIVQDFVSAKYEQVSAFLEAISNMENISNFAFNIVQIAKTVVNTSVYTIKEFINRIFF